MRGACRRKVAREQSFLLRPPRSSPSASRSKQRRSATDTVIQTRAFCGSVSAVPDAVIQTRAFCGQRLRRPRYEDADGNTSSRPPIRSSRCAAGRGAGSRHWAPCRRRGAGRAARTPAPHLAGSCAPARDTATTSLGFFFRKKKLNYLYTDISVCYQTHRV